MFQHCQRPLMFMPQAPRPPRGVDLDRVFGARERHCLLTVEAITEDVTRARLSAQLETSSIAIAITSRNPLTAMASVNPCAFHRRAGLECSYPSTPSLRTASAAARGAGGYLHDVGARDVGQDGSGRWRRVPTSSAHTRDGCTTVKTTGVRQWPCLMARMYTASDGCMSNVSCVPAGA
jgi:hypothetical protein